MYVEHRDDLTGHGRKLGDLNLAAAARATASARTGAGHDGVRRRQYQLL